MSALSCLDEYSWTGEFWLPEKRDKRFSGTLRYSPSEGIVLSYLLVVEDFSAEQSPVLHGVLDSGHPCSLLNGFRTNNAGISYIGGITTRAGRCAFSFLVLGGFVEQSDTFDQIKFRLPSLEEFFFPSTSEQDVSYSSLPILSAEMDSARFTLLNQGTFNPIFSGFENRFHSRDENALKALVEALQRVRSQYPNGQFSYRKKLEYWAYLDFAQHCGVTEACKKVTEICDLFAMLRYLPTYPAEVKVSNRQSDGTVSTFDVLQSLILAPRTVELLLRTPHHFDLAINARNTALGDVISKWSLSRATLGAVVSSIQNETGLRDLHEALGDIVLFATQFESISYSANQKKCKYMYPITTYACSLLANRLSTIFGKVHCTDVGAGVSDLRNDIAHVARPKKLLPLLSLRDLVAIGQCLQLTVLAYELRSIGIDAEHTDRFQERILAQ